MGRRRSILALLGVLLLGGCGSAGETISLAYVPFAQDRGIEPNSMRVIVESEDMRSAIGSKVSASIDWIGMESSAIENDRPIKEFVAEAIASEFEARGFVTEEGGARVHISVEQFFNNFQRGVGQGTAISQVGFRARVVNSDGETLYSNFYGGRAQRPVRLTNGANAKSTLEVAFYDAASRLATDFVFFRAVVDAATGGSVPDTDP